MAGSHRRPKWDTHYGAQADSGRTQDAQVVVWLYLDMLTLSSCKSPAAHVRRLKRKRRKESGA